MLGLLFSSHLLHFRLVFLPLLIYQRNAKVQKLLHFQLTMKQAQKLLGRMLKKHLSVHHLLHKDQHVPKCSQLLNKLLLTTILITLLLILSTLLLILATMLLILATLLTTMLIILHHSQEQLLSSRFVYSYLLVDSIFC